MTAQPPEDLPLTVQLETQSTGMTATGTVEAADEPAFEPSQPARDVHLLRPFRVADGARILDIGAGRGDRSRALADLGAQVTAIEPESDWAAFCHDRFLSEDVPVEVIPSALDDLAPSRTFDAVLMAGGFDPAAFAPNLAATPESLLSQVRARLQNHGVLILAVPNRLGADAMEIGCTRGELRGLLNQAGLTAQRWFFPFPDLPRLETLLSEEAFAVSKDDASEATVIDRLVRRAVPIAGRPLPNIERTRLREACAAGLALETASAFLVCAAADENALAAWIDEGVLAWNFRDDRRPGYQRVERLRQTADGLQMESEALHHEAVPEASWLIQTPAGIEAFQPGKTLEQHLLDASREGDAEGIEAWLQRWDAHLRGLDRPPAAEDLATPHPYLSAAPLEAKGSSVLPGDCLDAGLDRFVVTDGKALHRIAPEWHAGQAVDARRVRQRALWSLARDLIGSGQAKAWLPETTVEELAKIFGKSIGLEWRPGDFEQFWQSEADLQNAIRNADPSVCAAQLRQAGRWSQRSVEHHLGSRLRAKYAFLREGNAQGLEPSQAREQAYEARIQTLETQLAHFDQNLTTRGRHLAQVQAELQRSLAAEQSARQVYEAEIERLRSILERFSGIAPRNSTAADPGAPAALHQAYVEHEKAREAYEAEIARLNALVQDVLQAKNDAEAQAIALDGQVRELEAKAGWLFDQRNRLEHDLQHARDEYALVLERSSQLRATIERQWRSPIFRLKQLVTTALRRYRRLLRRWLG